MLLVLAGRHDAVARCVVRRWRDHGAALLSPADLSRSGWRVRFDRACPATIAVAGRQVAESQIRGVVVRLPEVTADELPQIAEEDRPYVASEMTAFLRAWLTALPAPVLNRPDSLGLTGPAWTREQAVLRAASLGIRVQPVRRATSVADSGVEAPLEASPTTMTVVGSRCLGAGAGELKARARELARSAGVVSLRVHFSSPLREARLVGVDPWIGLEEEQVADAAIAALRAGWPAMAEAGG